MARTARRLEPAAHWSSAVLAAAGGALLRNPMALGGATAFLIAMSFVSANAVWYQPHRHAGAFFATRPALEPPAKSRGRKEAGTVSERRAAARPVSDPTVRRVQAALRDLHVYDGPVDGLSGPATRKAIADFQTVSGFAATGKIDATLLAALVDTVGTTAGIPESRSRAAAPETVSAKNGDRERTMKIQAGLKAFGNEGIAVDGVMGARTRAAIREFQALFGLTETGEPDAALYAKMKEVGLTN